MSYALYDADGYVADVCTTIGLAQASIVAEGKPTLTKLLDSGELDALEVKKALKEVNGEKELMSLVEALKKARGAVLLTDGVVDEEEEPA